MIGVAFHWGLHPDFENMKGGLKRWCSFFIFPMQAFGADSLFVIGGPNIAHGYNINMEQFDTLEGLVKKYPINKYVAMVGSGGEDLANYRHTEKDVVYVIGNDYGDMDIDALPNPDKVTVPGGVKHLWSHNCAAIVLYDRSLKVGSHK